MSQLAIQVQGLGKRYTLGSTFGSHGTLYETLSGIFTRRQRAADPETLWALRDVNFEIPHGAVTGIVGRNGAGKSTLLKILSRITAPTEGRAVIRGRLASLLEVGTGFHPELSGRENIYLNGAILGMRRAQVQHRFDEIVAFAEVERFIDTPVKRYSSGMYVRLAFAVAAHLQPDILVVDEVLAVGDAAFQAKCLGKMDAIGRMGATVLVVSHNLAMMRKLCSRAILLEKGRLVYEGGVDDVCSKYAANGVDAAPSWSPTDALQGPFRYERISIREFSDGSREIQFRFKLSKPLSGRIAFTVTNDSGTVVFASADTDSMPFLNRRWTAGRWQELCLIPPNVMAPGKYVLNVTQPTGDGDVILEAVCSFEIDRDETLAARDGRAGVTAPLLRWECEELQ